MAIYKFFLGIKEGQGKKAYLFMAKVKPTPYSYPDFKYVVGPFKAPEEAVKYVISNKLSLCIDAGSEGKEELSRFLKDNPKIPSEVLEFRERVPKGSIMHPETFEGIEKKARKKKYKTPRAVAGKAYWTTLKAKYRKALQDYVVRGLQGGYLTKRMAEGIVEMTQGGLNLKQAKQFIKEVASELYSGKPLENPSYDQSFIIDLGIAESIISRGRSYERGWSDEGDVESGPMGGALKGFRLGKYLLEETRNGSIVLWGPKQDQVRHIYNSHVGTKEPRVRKIVEIFRVMKTRKNFDSATFATLAGASAVGTMIGKKLLGNPSSGKVYIGLAGGKREIFRSTITPTQAAFPQYKAVIGPFRTKRAALLMKVPGSMYETVGQAERVGRIKKNPKKSHPLKRKGLKSRGKGISSQEKIIIIALETHGGSLPVKSIPGYMLHALATLQEWGAVKVEKGIIILQPARIIMDTIKENPPAGAVKIYEDILAIEAKKGQDSLWPEENFRHDFKARKGKAAIFGMPDGSLLVKGKKRLWKKFEYGKEDV